MDAWMDGWIEVDSFGVLGPTCFHQQRGWFQVFNQLRTVWQPVKLWPTFRCFILKVFQTSLLWLQSRQKHLFKRFNRSFPFLIWAVPPSPSSQTPPVLAEGSQVHLWYLQWRPTVVALGSGSSSAPWRTDQHRYRPVAERHSGQTQGRGRSGWRAGEMYPFPPSIKYDLQNASHHRIH